jgi:glutathione S-transferase
MATEYRLITIPPSHYCEKARWALEHAGIAYREEGHPPLLHRLAVKLAKGGRSTPVLVAGDRVLPDSTDILQFIDVEHADGWRPYPTDSQLRVEALAGVGAFERTLFKALSPVIKKLMRVGMRIDDAGAERSLGYVENVFASVGELLADGRSYLVGKKFGAADLTFAALAAPVLLPRNYGSPLPSLDEVPAELLAQIEDFRSSPAGDFALRIYRDHRCPPALALHGWLDNGASFDRLAPMLSGLHLVALDLAGHGRSQHRHPSVVSHFIDWAPEIVAVADRLGWETFVLIGHSMGAGISSLVAGTSPIVSGG